MYTWKSVFVIDNPQGLSPPPILPSILPFFHTGTEVCISNIYPEICYCMS